MRSHIPLVFALLAVVPSLAAPPPVPAAPRAVSVQDLSRRSVVNNLVSGACPHKLKPGLFDAPCFGGLAGRSWGSTCLTFNISEGGASKYEELACVNTCPGMRNSDPCSATPCYEALAGRPYSRTFAALDPETQRKMAADYTKLIALVQAEASNQRNAYTSLGGDQERARVKFEILGFVIAGFLNQSTGQFSAPGAMLPFGECLLKRAAAREKIGNPEVSLSKLYGQPPQQNTGNPADASPMDTSAGGTLHLYESAFIACSRVTPDLGRCLGGIGPESPDALAGSIIHELVHYTQKRFGHEEGAGGLNDAASDLKTMLNEIEAYGVSRDDLFYTKALSVNDYIALTRAGLSAQVGAFQSLWQKAGAAVQEEVAGWAWEIPWMRARMVRRNRPAQEGNTWNLTCVAMQRKSPVAGNLCGKFAAEP
jgi:hypothetical protein